MRNMPMHIKMFCIPNNSFKKEDVTVPAKYDGLISKGYFVRIHVAILLTAGSYDVSYITMLM